MQQIPPWRKNSQSALKSTPPSGPWIWVLVFPFFSSLSRSHVFKSKRIWCWCCRVHPKLLPSYWKKWGFWAIWHGLCKDVRWSQTGTPNQQWYSSVLWWMRLLNWCNLLWFLKTEFFFSRNQKLKLYLLIYLCKEIQASGSEILQHLPISIL